MKILLTGAGGMVGRNLLDHEGAQRHTVLAPVRSELDLSKYDSVMSYLKAHQPDLIIHAAGRVGGIQANIQSPVAFLVDNIDINRNLLLAALQVGIKKLISLGSSCMYPRGAKNPLGEDLILTGELEPTNEGYALAKIFALRLCQYIRRENPELNYKTLIPCNLYGAYDKFDALNSHLIPAILRKMDDAMKESASAVDIWGTGTARREFMYAEDLADCVWNCVDRYDEVPDVMNVGLGEDHSINDYYEAARAIVGFKGEFVHDLSKPVGMQQKLVDIERQKKFGWKPRFSLQEGMSRTYRYYQSLSKKGS